mmetsp:Transcript_17668/g.27354  ORF Transcript_17668/g.27354 Transcript_17668/m.27354 type:complete len:92 (+) Transcript_17668:930-1205(+)
MKSPTELNKLIFSITFKSSAQYVQLKLKEYELNSEKKLMVQIVDVSQDILYQKANAENEFLSITNATVSHELRNPLQSILSQNLKVEICIS